MCIDPEGGSPAADDSRAGGIRMTQVYSHPSGTPVPPFASDPQLGVRGAAGPGIWKPKEEVLDGYAVDEPLGVGTFGQVYKLSIRVPELREYAVKRLLLADHRQPEPGGMQPKSDVPANFFRRLFLREMQTWIDLPEHPNLVTFRFPRLEDDALYLFADYIDGGSLNDWMRGREEAWEKRKEPTSLASILDIAIQIAWGLQALHSWKVTHADLKPANVLLTKGGLVKVGDFGLTGATSAGGTFGYPEGTLYYRSPEQHKRLPLEFPTDLWSWAVIVLQMFWGAVPDGPDPDQVKKNLATAVASDPQLWLPPIPEPVAALLRRCFATKPTDRPESAGKIAEELRAYLEQTGQPHGRDEPRFLDVAGRTLESHDRRSRFGGQWADTRELLVSLVGPEATQKLLLPRDGLGRRAQAVADLAAYEEARRLLTSPVQQLDVGTGPRQDLERELALTLLNKALIHEQLDDTPGQLAHYNRAIELLDPLVDTRPELAAAWTNKGLALEMLGRLAEALAAHDRAIGLYEPLMNTRPELASDLAGAWTNKGVALGDLGRLPEALAAYDRAIDFVAPLVNTRPELANYLAGAWVNKGSALADLGRLAEALAAHDRAIGLYEPLMNTRPELASDLAGAWMNKGNALVGLGRFAEALAAHDRAIGLYEPLVDTRRELANDLAAAWMNKGNTLIRLGRLAEALTAFDRAIGLYEPLVDTRRELANDLAAAWMGKGNALQFLGQFADALAAHDRAIGLYEPLMNTRPELASDLAGAWTNKGVALGDLGRLPEALAAYDRAI
ncbi:protein kinase, partial [Accumulibacter sp.]|uniref:serine/threonine-protein kinase n=1 Tax=Accumulibacter sp. TaxID=2053492 RepID=UPI002609F2FF